MPEGTPATPPPAAAGLPPAPPLPGAASPAGPAPAPGPTAPATAPADLAGMSARGRVQVSLAMKMLEQAISALGSTTEEGQEVLQTLARLSKRFGQSSKDLSRGEVKMLGESAGAIQAPSAQGGAQLAQMVRAKQAGMGLGGGAGGGAA